MSSNSGNQPAEWPAPKNGQTYWQRYKHQPHWRNNRDEYDAAKLGMWLFLATELLLFSGMFCAYAVFKMLHYDSFHHASHHFLSWEIGSINTAVLLISSFTVAMAIRNVQLNQQFWAKINLFITIICGLAFLVIKLGWEYWPKYVKGELPGINYTYVHGEYAYEPIFLAVYWVATAIHGSHVLVGVLLLAWCLRRTQKGHFGPRHFTALENTGLFWHLVDLIWIFLFPLLYLAP